MVLRRDSQRVRPRDEDAFEKNHDDLRQQPFEHASCQSRSMELAQIECVVDLNGGGDGFS